MNIGTARANAGDDGGIADPERAIAIAKATNNQALARAYNNRGALESNLERALEWQRLAKEAADRLGHGPVGAFVEGQLITSSFELGHWDEFLGRAESFLATLEAGAPSYNEVWTRIDLAEISLARDQDEAATSEAARALAVAREVKDPQALQPSLAINVQVDLALGRVESARGFARELLTLLSRGVTTYGLIGLALAADVLEIRDDVRQVITTLPERSSVRIASAILDGDFVAAAEIQAAEAWRVGEAELRLRAAESLVAQGQRAEADVQLQQALAFYRSVGATRFVREGEALLAATA